jgi:hypothetical protein
MLIVLETLVTGEGWSVGANRNLDRLYLSFNAPSLRWQASSNGELSVEMMAAQFLAMIEHYRVAAEAIAARAQAQSPEHDGAGPHLPQER